MVDWFSIRLVGLLNRLFPPLKMHKVLSRDKLDVRYYQTREYEEAKKVCPEFGDLWELHSKRVLDVGSGLGGKPLYYSELDPEYVAALDLRSFSVAATQELARKQGGSPIYPVLANAADIPITKDSLDVIVSINVFEHVDDLSAVLRECKRVLRPGGLIFLHFPPFYSPWGAHVEGWINFPWPHVLFSDRVLIRAIRQAEENRKLNEDYIPPAKVDWESVERLPELNRITVAGFKNIVKEIGLHVVESHMLPFGYHYLSNQGHIAREVLRFLKVLAKLPVCGEIVTTKMVFILAKQ